jgi:hypothetical protein
VDFKIGFIESVIILAILFEVDLNCKDVFL